MPSFRLSAPGGLAYPFDELRDELDRLWTSLTAAPPLHGWGVRSDSGTFPAVNVSENDDAILVEAELPGLDAGDVDIAVSGEELVLKGARPEPAAPSSGEGGNGERNPVTWHRRERGSGGFERRLALPVAIDASRVEAKLVDGVLTVTCPKAPASQPHKVVVRAG